MDTMKKRQKITFILLLAGIVLAGALLYLQTLNRGELEESPEPSSVAPEEVSDLDKATELQDVEAESELEEEVDLRVKVGSDEFPVIFEDGDYENLDRARLIWTVNNLFKSGQDFEMVPINVYNSRKYYVEGREVEAKFYLLHSGSGHRPKIKIRYTDIIEVDGVNHLVLPRQFIEAYIEASSKYAELTDELNDFINRLNQVKSTEIDNMTEAQIDSMLHLGPKIADEAGLEGKRRGLREFTVDIHFQSTNVFWIEESAELGRHFYGDDAESIIFGQAIIYKKEGNLPSWLSEENATLDLPPPV